MNREIKFRAWDEQNKEMRYPKTAAENFGHGGSNSADILKFYSIVMQYTGLKDKNGADIYEGDVVVVTEPSENGFPEIKHKPVAVEWVISGFGLGYVSNTMPDYWGYEIIGNIYQNPELIKTA